MLGRPAERGRSSYSASSMSSAAGGDAITAALAVSAAGSAEYADEYIRNGKRDFQQKIPVNVDLVSAENIDKFTAYGKKD